MNGDRHFSRLPEEIDAGSHRWEGLEKYESEVK